VEPLEANITALLDTARVKWAQYLSPGIKVPTEWDKATYDSLVNRITVISAEPGWKGRSLSIRQRSINKSGNRLVL
jgi:hypothetical protein